MLIVDSLTVGFSGRTVVRDVSFAVGQGEALALVGESGSGKSVTARSLIGLAGDHAELSARRLDAGGMDLLALREKQWRAVRGKRIGFVLQDALVSLDPLKPVGAEIDEALRVHTALTKQERDAKVVQLLGAVGVPKPELRARQLPGELSGGLRQRALIASAIAADPDILIADEPTTALDVTVQAQILDLLNELKGKGRSLILISHDLAVVSRVADRVAVMRDGSILESGDIRTVFTDPTHEYTRTLLAAVPSEHTKGERLSPGSGIRAALEQPRQPGPVVASVVGLTKTFTAPDGSSHRAVHHVSFELRAGETVGIVGESGSGKTTTGRLVLGLAKPDDGTVTIADEHGALRAWSDVTGAERRSLRRSIQMIYQDALSSFDPRHTVGRIIAEAVRVTGVRGTAVTSRVVELLEQVGLGQEYLDRRPLKLSGGQRQRVAIARALAAKPRILLLDEPVSALDVSIQAQVLDLLSDLQEETGVASLFISHDIGVVHHMSDRVLVMKDGDVVESGDSETVFRQPSHPYTRQLLDAVPRLDLEAPPLEAQSHDSEPRALQPRESEPLKEQVYQ